MKKYKRITAPVPSFNPMKTYVDGIEVEYLITDISAGNAINKLGKHEDIEKEKGIDLITLFEAVDKGFYYKSSEDNSIRHVSSYVSNRSYGFVCIEYAFISYYEIFMGQVRKEMQFYFRDYGEKWALSLEELTRE